MRVHPTLIPKRRLLANVNGVKNAVLVEGDAVGPTLYYGAGAGAEPTASAVVADLVDLARDLSAGQSNRASCTGCGRRKSPGYALWYPWSRWKLAWYLRMEAQDKPGVMSQIVTSIFSEQGISIEGLIQKAPVAEQSAVPVVVLTNTARQHKVDAAVQAIEALDTINGSITRIRVATLDG